MADIAEDLITHLNAHAAGVGASVGGRIHQTHVPQRSQYPNVFMLRSGKEEMITLDGRDTNPLIRENWDIESLSTGLDEANTIGKRVVDALHGVRGADWLGATNTVQGVFVESKDDGYVPRGNGTDEGVAVVAHSVVIWYLKP